MTGGRAEAPAETRVVYVEEDAALASACERMAGVRRIGIDTEFVGERSYVPRLELVQVAMPGETFLIDCAAVRRLDPFFAVLANERVEKVLHAGQQDLELFHGLTGRTPTPVLDTQVAAAMAGYGAQPGYADLVHRALGLTVEKTETLTDWSHRPLTPAQLAYAVDDVRHLLPLFDHLRRRLTRLGRWEWVREECRRVAESAKALRLDPAEAYLRVRGRGVLRARGLAVLRALARWREEVARERNKPRSTVARDEALVEIARKAPTTLAALKGLRAVRSREIDRHAEEIVRRVAAALDTPRGEWPEPAPQNGAQPSTGVVELLQAVLRLRAEEASIAPSLLATQAELLELVRRHDAGQEIDLSILRGWRYEIAGRDLLAVLEGRATVALEPAPGRVRVCVTARESAG